MSIDYPEEHELKKIKEWDDDIPALMEYVKELWIRRYGHWKQTGSRYDLSTCGWSGNEDIITALQDNTMFWMLCWQNSKRGGHYVFEVRQ